jgi:hypothetical protein
MNSLILVLIGEMFDRQNGFGQRARGKLSIKLSIGDSRRSATKNGKGTSSQLSQG